MHRLFIDYRARDDENGVRNGHWKHFAVQLCNVRRPLLWCRLFGHRPVVDGVGKPKKDGVGYCSRWVVCDRCGVRGEPQGQLDPERYDEGDPYAGPYAPLLPAGKAGRERLHALKGAATYPPGPIPYRAEGDLGAEVVIGHAFGGTGFELKVGSGGSEHTLAANFHLWPIGSLYLHTERFGLGVQRLLNPTGYDSRIIGVRLNDGRLSWTLWGLRDGPSGKLGNRREWRFARGELDLRLLDKVLGPARYEYTDVGGGTTTGLVRMPEAEYLVDLRLKRETHGRRRWRKRHAWSVQWNALGPGIPTEGPLRRRITGGSVTVSDRSVTVGTWPAEAVARIGVRFAEHRTRYRWSPRAVLPVDTDTLQVRPQAERGELVGADA